MVMNDNLEKEAQSAEATIPAEEVKATETAEVSEEAA